MIKVDPTCESFELLTGRVQKMYRNKCTARFFWKDVFGDYITIANNDDIENYFEEIQERGPKARAPDIIVTFEKKSPHSHSPPLLPPSKNTSARLSPASGFGCSIQQQSSTASMRVSPSTAFTAVRRITPPNVFSRQSPQFESNSDRNSPLPVIADSCSTAAALAKGRGALTPQPQRVNGENLCESQKNSKTITSRTTIGVPGTTSPAPLDCTSSSATPNTLSVLEHELAQLRSAKGYFNSATKNILRAGSPLEIVQQRQEHLQAQAMRQAYEHHNRLAKTQQLQQQILELKLSQSTRTSPTERLKVEQRFQSSPVNIQLQVEHQKNMSRQISPTGTSASCTSGTGRESRESRMTRSNCGRLSPGNFTSESVTRETQSRSSSPAAPIIESSGAAAGAAAARGVITPHAVRAPLSLAQQIAVQKDAVRQQMLRIKELERLELEEAQKRNSVDAESVQSCSSTSSGQSSNESTGSNRSYSMELFLQTHEEEKRHLAHLELLQMQLRDHEEHQRSQERGLDQEVGRINGYKESEKNSSREMSKTSKLSPNPNQRGCEHSTKTDHHSHHKNISTKFSEDKKNTKGTIKSSTRNKHQNNSNHKNTFSHNENKHFFRAESKRDNSLSTKLSTKNGDGRREARRRGKHRIPRDMPSMVCATPPSKQNQRKKDFRVNRNLLGTNTIGMSTDSKPNCAGTKRNTAKVQLPKLHEHTSESKNKKSSRRSKPQPKWVHNDKQTHCSGASCGCAFTWLTRRHHCRACGKIFCGTCVSARMELSPNQRIISPAKSRRKLHRVCTDCHDKIMNQKSRDAVVAIRKLANMRDKRS